MSKTEFPELSGLNGETRVVVIVGDPIAQVKSPAGVTREFIGRGRNALVVPIHVTPVDLDVFIQGISLARNCDGIIATVPHKFALSKHCKTLTERARLLGAVNVLRRNPDGSWHGDMFDGFAMLSAMCEAGCEPQDKPALLIGAGGAGSAIAFALLDAGVSELAIHDEEPDRRDFLITRLNAQHGGRARIGSSDPSDAMIIVNATPTGMREGDPYPVLVEKLTPDMFVADVITVPSITPMIEAARRLGCATQAGGGMFSVNQTVMVDFLLESGPLSR